MFVDIGANVGYAALLAAKRVGSSGAVVAIEASPSTFAPLCEQPRVPDSRQDLLFTRSA